MISNYCHVFNYFCYCGTVDQFGPVKGFVIAKFFADKNFLAVNTLYFSFTQISDFQ